MGKKLVKIGLFVSDWLEYFLTKYEFSAEQSGYIQGPHPYSSDNTKLQFDVFF